MLLWGVPRPNYHAWRGLPARWRSGRGRDRVDQWLPPRGFVQAFNLLGACSATYSGRSSHTAGTDEEVGRCMPPPPVVEGGRHPLVNVRLKVDHARKVYFYYYQLCASACCSRAATGRRHAGRQPACRGSPHAHLAAAPARLSEVVQPRCRGDETQTASTISRSREEGVVLN